MKSLSHVRLFATPRTDYSLAGYSVHGIFQARILEWVAISFPRDWTQVSRTVGRRLIIWATREVKVTPKYIHTYRPLKYENEFSNRFKTDEYPQGGNNLYGPNWISIAKNYFHYCQFSTSYRTVRSNSGDGSDIYKIRNLEGFARECSAFCWKDTPFCPFQRFQKYLQWHIYLFYLCVVANWLIHCWINVLCLFSFFPNQLRRIVPKATITAAKESLKWYQKS